MNMTPRILGLGKKDLTQIAASTAKGREIYASYSGLVKGPASFENLDMIFKAWAEDKSVTKADNDEMANGFGCLFGELLKAEFGFGWQIIEDQFGSEPALVDEVTGSVVYPINSVWKRIEPKIDTTAFFKPMRDAIKQHLDSLK